MPRFQAAWPIVDPATPLEDLQAEALDELPRLLPADYKLMGGRLTWEHNRNELRVTVTVRREQKLPVEPALRYLRTQPPLTDALRAIVADARRRGGFTIRAADTFAVRLGTHPFFIWGDAWFVDMEAAS